MSTQKQSARNGIADEGRISVLDEHGSEMGEPGLRGARAEELSAAARKM